MISSGSAERNVLFLSNVFFNQNPDPAEKTFPVKMLERFCFFRSEFSDSTEGKIKQNFISGQPVLEIGHQYNHYSILQVLQIGYQYAHYSILITVAGNRAPVY